MSERVANDYNLPVPPQAGPALRPDGDDVTPDPGLNSLDAPPTHNITTVFVHQTAVDVGSRNENDILQWIQNTAREDDFVALKFDVDNDSLGPTMEWGFLADLLRRPEALALVDELFIELHFAAPSLNWVHLTHSMKQAFDVLRQLRACGLPVHAWP